MQLIPDPHSLRRAPVGSERWLGLLTIARLTATAAAVLLVVTRVPNDRIALAAVALVYGVGSVLAFVRSSRLRAAPAAWALDCAAALALTFAFGDWRSPFYLLQLTTLVLPATTLALRPALAFGAAFTLAYLGVAIATGIGVATLGATVRVETLGTHLMVPLLVVLSLAYAAKLLRRIEAERERSERLVVEAERRRIAWELHDSAKQRVHAAHLVLGMVEDEVDGTAAAGVAQAMHELRCAGADMDTSVNELRAPLLESRRLIPALRERARELAAASDAVISVEGGSDALPPIVVAHAYRIAGEALTNAVRHADARHIHVRVAQTPGALELVVRDDGRGMPDMLRPGSNGLHAMRSRAETLGGELEIATPAGSRGTAVRLRVPLDMHEGAVA